MTTQRFIGTVKRRSLVVWSVIAVGLGLMFALRELVPASYAGSAHVVLVAENGARDPSVSIVDLPSIATSTVVLQRVRKSLNLPMTLIKMKKNVSASVLGRSSIMAIGFQDTSAERAIDVTNGIADELSRYYSEISTVRYDTNVDRLSSELTAEAVRLHALDTEMSSEVSKNPFVVSDKSIDNITTHIVTMSEQRATLLAQLQADEALAAATAPNSTLAKTARHEILVGDPAYVAQKTAAAADAAQLASDRATYTKTFPGLPGELAKISGEDAAMKREEARAMSDPNAYSESAAEAALAHAKQLAIVAGDQAHLNSIDALIAADKNNLAALPTTGSTYSQLEAERSALEAEYGALASRRANALANRAEASSLGSVVVLDRAIKADTQLNGARTRAAIVGLILIFALAIGAAFLAESLDPRVRRAEEIEELYGIPVVASFGSK